MYSSLYCFSHSVNSLPITNSICSPILNKSYEASHYFVFFKKKKFTLWFYTGQHPSIARSGRFLHIQFPMGDRGGLSHWCVNGGELHSEGLQFRLCLQPAATHQTRRISSVWPNQRSIQGMCSKVYVFYTPKPWYELVCNLFQNQRESELHSRLLLRSTAIQPL